MPSDRTLSPAAISLLIQLGAVALAWGLTRLWPLPIIGFALLAGLLACGLSMLARQARWWWAINLVFLPAAVVAREWAIAPAWFLAGFVVLALIYWNSARGQVPLYLSNARTAQAVLATLPSDRPITLIDAGCGTGSLVRRIARARPDCRVIGVENAPLPWAVCKLLARGVALRFGDLWQQHFGGADVVYAFLSPVPMPKLWEKCTAEMRPGAMLMSNTFAVPGVTPDEVIEVNDGRRTRLFCYVIKAPVAG